MNRTARVLVTHRCEKNCAYCVDKFPSITEQKQILTDVQQLAGYEEICISGGEPGLVMDRVSDLITAVRNINPSCKIFMYTAIYHEAMVDVIPYLDGMNYTIHNRNPIAIRQFMEFQRMIWTLPTYLERKWSFRLMLAPDINTEIRIMPSLWSEIRVKSFKAEGECILPVHEDLWDWPE